MTEKLIYHGDRGESFKKVILGWLSRGNISSQYIDLLVNEESMKQYGMVFTSKSADFDNNYEVYENMGDVTVNKFIIWYMYNRFPQLNCTDGVKVVSRIRINYGSKASFAPLGEKLGFWPYITAFQTERDKDKKRLLEDCFEAIIGCTESLIDKHTRIGVGYAIVYEILKSLFDELNISLSYTDLYDAHTRLKELFDFYNKDLTVLGGYKILSEKNENKINTSYVYRIPGKNTNDLTLKTIVKPQSDWILIGKGSAPLLSDSEKKACENALQNLAEKGFSKNVSKIYQMFCK